MSGTVLVNTTGKTTDVSLTCLGATKTGVNLSIGMKIAPQRMNKMAIITVEA